MIELSEFPKHLETISQADWNILFEINEQLKSTPSFGQLIASEEIEPNVSTFAYWNQSPLTSEFVKFLYDRNLLPSFDWQDWKEGKKLMKDQNFNDADIVSLFKLLTAIIRADRFIDGTIISAFQNRTIQLIVDAIKLKINQRN